jgi:hypothetical protein
MVWIRSMEEIPCGKILVASFLVLDKWWRAKFSQCRLATWTRLCWIGLNVWHWFWPELFTTRWQSFLEGYAMRDCLAIVQRLVMTMLSMVSVWNFGFADLLSLESSIHTGSNRFLRQLTRTFQEWRVLLQLRSHTTIVKGCTITFFVPPWCDLTRT